MSESVKIFFELEDGADKDAILFSLEQGLKKIQSIESSMVREHTEKVLGVDDVVVLLGAIVLVAKSAKEVIDVTADILDSVKELVKSIKGLKAVVVETKSGPKKLQEVKAGDI